MIRRFLFGMMLLGLLGCRTVRPWPPVNLAEPGWHVRQGQAIWRPNRQAPEIAGELLVATRPDGNAFLQFSKNPFPFVVARMRPDEWRIEFLQPHKTYTGHGALPARLIWLQLANWLEGNALPKVYSHQESSTNHWRLENHNTGEVLEGYLKP